MKGRTPPPLPEFTLPVCGRTVHIRPLGSFRMEAIRDSARKAIPKPTPPMVEVSLMGSEPQLQPNDADPEYIAALRAWEMEIFFEVGRRMVDVMQTYAVVYEPDLEVLAEYRAAMAAAGIELDEDDRAVWFRHFLIDADEDNSALTAAVLRRSQPTEEAVQEKVESFPGDVQGS